MSPAATAEPSRNGNGNKKKKTVSNNLSNVKFLFRGTGKLFRYDRDKQDWKLVSRQGEARIFLYSDGSDDKAGEKQNKVGVSFLRDETQASCPSYCQDNTVLIGRINQGMVHNYMSTDDSHRSVVFGKMPSWTYVDKNGKAIKTAWVVNFFRTGTEDDEEGTLAKKDAECFLNLFRFFANSGDGKSQNESNKNHLLNKISEDEADGRNDANEEDAKADDANADDDDPYGYDDDIAPSQPIVFRNNNHALNETSEEEVDGGKDANEEDATADDANADDDDPYGYDDDIAPSQPIVFRNPFADEYVEQN